MWRRGARACLLVLGGGQVRLRLVEGARVLCETAVEARNAGRLAEIYEIEEECRDARRALELIGGGDVMRPYPFGGNLVAH